MLTPWSSRCSSKSTGAICQRLLSVDLNFLGKIQSERGRYVKRYSKAETYPSKTLKQLTSLFIYGSNKNNYPVIAGSVVSENQPSEVGGLK